ncbi:DEAD/DEAH box helicase [Geomonas sp. Red32]|uniref:DEAD/DEAH box helicase n=1 Tax=Geomonas sp. Red32 TaxID=2912856 RepID=UPI00202CD9DC|nr:DEAD/DEAH box helicase [Geomonas sp. Red32]MCM0081681.1 DEAD/DEAH box helicase [Geomonas sp. Red32]
MDNRGNPLLRHLLEMPPAAIYRLADKIHLFNGFELCKRTPVSGLSWSGDGSVLTVRIKDAVTVDVSLTLSQGELSTTCDCGVWSPRGRCPHLVAALATVKKVLSPPSFPMLHLPADYLRSLSGQLWTVASVPQAAPAAVMTEEPAYSLVVELGEDGGRLRFCRSGVPLVPWEPDLIPSIREFLRLLYNPLMKGRAVEEFLTRFGARYPVLFASPEGPVPLVYDAALERSLILRLDLQGDQVAVTKTLDDGHGLGSDRFICEGYLVDLALRRIQKIDEQSANGHLTRLIASLQLVPEPCVERDEEGLRIAAACFNQSQYTVAEDGRFFDKGALFVEGRPSVAAGLPVRYRLNILELAENVQLVAEGVAGDTPFQLSRDTFWFFPSASRARLPQPLKAKKRVASILEACFATLAGGSRTDKERIVRLALDGPDFCKRNVKAEARRMVTSFWQSLTQPRTLLQVVDGHWVQVPVDAEAQARLLRIPFDLLGPEIFTGTEIPGEMAVERKLFMKNIGTLRSELSAAGFHFAMGGEELETVSWSFTLDATRSTIDWFELRPEIRCEGELVDEGELMEAIKSGGVFRRGGAMLLLDEESARALALFSAHPKREVVRVPRLQILDWLILRRSGVRVLLSPEDERIIESLMSFERIPPRPVPAKLKAVLRNYQREGYSWLAFLYEHRFGACLADDMGLGKTVQAIALIAGLQEGVIESELPEGVPHLVVVPPSLIFNWESEIGRFYPSLKVGVYRGQGRRAEFGGFDLVLTSYGVIQRDIEHLSALSFNVIVFDEAQAIKNIHAETTGAVRRLKGRFKLTLTGTPVENHLGEYFSVMDLALPGLLGPYEQFRKQMGRDGEGFMETLSRRTHPFILRRAKDMIRSELPPKVETDIYLEMSPRQKALYVRTVAEVKATVAEAYRSNAPGQARIIALTAILKLRQICLSSRLLLPRSPDRAPKIDFLIDQLEELFAEGHSVLVFSQFTSFLDLVEEGLSQQGIVSSRLDGSTPISRRKELVEGFQSSEEPGVFLLSLKAGGKGLNLTKASYVFHLDPWWNPAVESQASDRAHRIGQLRQVTITRLLMRHSIEEKMMELKKRKLKLYRALLEDAEHEGTGAIGREDFEFLLG